MQRMLALQIMRLYELRPSIVHAEEPNLPALSSLGGDFHLAPAAGSDGRELGRTAGMAWSGNCLKLTDADIRRCVSGDLLVNSGSRADDLTDLDPGNWQPAARVMLAERLAAIRPVLRDRGSRLLLEPCSRHILHDAQTILLFWTEFAVEEVALALNPVALFEPSMLEHRDDHLTRIFETLGRHAAMLVLTDAQVSRGGDRLNLCPLGRGLFEPAAILALCRTHCRPDLPILVAIQRSDGHLPAALGDLLGRPVVN